MDEKKIIEEITQQQSLDVFRVGCDRKNFAILSEINKKEVMRVDEICKQFGLTSMPAYRWDRGDFEIYVNQLMKLFEPEKIQKIFESHSKKNQFENIKLEQEFFKESFSKLSRVFSEQIALLKAERRHQTNLTHLRISRELIEALTLIRSLTERILFDMQKGKLTKAKIKKFKRTYPLIALLYLRVYSISNRVRNRNIKRAVQEVDFLSMELIEAEV